MIRVLAMNERVSFEIERVDGWIHTHVFIDGEFDETISEHQDDYLGVASGLIEDICAKL